MKTVKLFFLTTLFWLLCPYVSQAQYSGVFLNDNASHKIWRLANWSFFTQKWQDFAEAGYKLVDIEITEGNSGPLYSGVFRQQAGGYALYRYSTWEAFITKWQNLNTQGFRLIDYELGGGFHTGVWVAGGGDYALECADSWGEFITLWQEKSAMGLKLIDYENVNGFHLGVWREGLDGQKVARASSYSSFTSIWSNYASQGYRLIDYERNSGYHTGVWIESNKSYGLWINTSWASLINKRNEWAPHNLQLIDLEIDDQNAPPKISVENLYPMEGKYLVYQKLARKKSTLSPQAQLTVDILMKNMSGSSKKVDKVIMRYAGNGIYFPIVLKNDLKLKIGSTVYKVVDEPSISTLQQFKLMLIKHPLVPQSAPTSVKIEVYFKGFAKPIVIERKIKPHKNAPPAGSYLFPAKIKDLASGEFWSGSSSNGSSHHRKSTAQFYAHDMGIAKWDSQNDKWTDKYPGKDGSQNNHYRVWGKPIYAMADGEVVSWDDGNEDHLPKIDPEDYSAPNFFVIRHGDETAYYYHLKNGSLNDDLKQNGAIVKAGQYLGQVGNSGHSSHPHLHLDVRKNGSGRPIHFRKAYVVSRDYVTDGKASEALWAKIDEQGLPISKNIIWPSAHKPFAVPGKFTGVWRSGNDGHYIWVGASWGHFVAKWQELSAKGFRLMDIETYKENGVRKYHGVWRSGNDAHYLWAGVTWTNFRAKWLELAQQNLRLVDMETYEVNGQRRYIGVWRSGNDAHYLWVGASWASFHAKWSQLSSRNLRLVDMETYIVNGQRKYLGIWRAGSDGHYLWVGDNWSGFRNKWSSLSQNNLRLIDVETYKVGNQRKYLGVWRQGNDAHYLWSGVSWNSYLKKYEALAEKGLRPIDLEIHYDNQIQERKAPEAPEESLVSSSALQTYPNPFSETTKIAFDVPFDAKVNLSILNMTGQIVAKPISNQQRVAGKYQLDFHADNLPSGIYICVLDINGKRHTKKLVLARNGDNR